MDVEFVYDYRSPYAYLADTQLPTPGAGILYKPVEIFSVMKADFVRERLRGAEPEGVAG